MHSLSRTCRQFWFLQRPSRSPSRYNAAKATPALKSELARDIRAVPITLLTVAKRDSESANAMVGEWLDKLRRYTTVKEVNVKPNPKQSPNPLIQMAAEGEKVLTRALERDAADGAVQQASTPTHCLTVCYFLRFETLYLRRGGRHELRQADAPRGCPDSFPRPLLLLQVAKAIDQGDWVVLLDERGRPVTSEDVARIIAAAGTCPLHAKAVAAARLPAS